MSWANYCCIQVVGPVGTRTPVRLCASLDPRRLLKEMQVHHWLPMEIFYRVWVPSLAIGRRMIEQECGLLETWKLRGSWYNITPDTAERAIHVAARNCRVPLLADVEYRQLSDRDKAERLLERAGAMATGLRTT